MMKQHDIPVIAIDGPSASGKGTVAQQVADRLGYHYLDSGALYRLVALSAMQSGIDLNDPVRLAEAARHLDVTFTGGEILSGSQVLTEAIRTEACGNGASVAASYPAVREALLERQRAFRKLPGLVADGRDMGSVVFNDAALKIFLTASAGVRAQRRYKQLIEKGIDANINTLLQDITERDARDSGRSVAPLQQGMDAVLLDTTALGVTEAVNVVLEQYACICIKNKRA